MLTKFMGLPEAFSDHGPLMDHMLDIIQWVGVALGVGWSIFFVVVLFRFWRGRSKRASYAGVTGHTSTHLEIGVVIVEAMLLLGFAFPLWSARVDDFPDGPDVVHCRVIAFQFNWLVHYPGKDGIFGATDPRLYSAENPYGVVKDDPNGADDVFQTSLYVPEGHPVIMYVTSKDVIHNVAIVALRVALDAIPGTEHRFHFTATKEGEYDIICGQLCGEGHAQMRGACVVVSEKDWASDYAHFDNAVIAPPDVEKTDKAAADDKDATAEAAAPAEGATPAEGAAPAEGATPAEGAAPTASPSANPAEAAAAPATAPSTPTVVAPGETGVADEAAANPATESALTTPVPSAEQPQAPAAPTAQPASTEPAAQPAPTATPATTPTPTTPTAPAAAPATPAASPAPAATPTPASTPVPTPAQSGQPAPPPHS